MNRLKATTAKFAVRHFAIFKFFLRTAIVFSLFVSVYGISQFLTTFFGAMEPAPFAPFKLGLVINFASSLIWIFLTWLQGQVHHLPRYLLEINNKENNQKQLVDYFATIGSLINPKLPPEVKLSWKDMPWPVKTCPFFIRLEAKQIRKEGATPLRRGHIPDLFNFVDFDLLEAAASPPKPPLLIQGEPGSGKSTAVYEVFRQQAARYMKHKSGWIPILLFAQDIRQKRLESSDFKEFLFGFLADMEFDYGISLEGIKRFIQVRYALCHLLIIIDGLDEIVPKTKYEAMLIRLNRLIELENNEKGAVTYKRFILTTRTDDNIGKVSGDLVSLCGADHGRSIAYLKKLVTWYRKRKAGDDANKFSCAIKGLQKTKRDRLLQNYVSNPYLLSLIIEFYKEKFEFLAEKLGEVFKKVLRRELEKKRSCQVDQEEIDKELLVFQTVLGPFCFHSSFLKNEEDLSVSQALLEERAITDLLHRFIEGKRTNNSQMQREAYGDLKDLLGKETAGKITSYIESNISQTTDANILNNAASWITTKVLRQMAAANLIQLGPNNTIHGFRHRALKDYFAARFLFQNGWLNRKIDFGNGWLHEPLRLTAALSDNPMPLFEGFSGMLLALGNSQQKMTTILIKKSHVLRNAAACIAYLLPARKYMNSEELAKIVSSIGDQVQSLYTDCLSDEIERQLFYQRELCFGMLRDIYGSEFVADQTVPRFPILKSPAVSFWKKFKLSLRVAKPAIHQMAFPCLSQAKKVNPEFPISSFELDIYLFDSVPFSRATYDRVLMGHFQRHMCWRFAVYFRIVQVMSLVFWGLFGYVVITKTEHFLLYFLSGYLGFAMLAQERGWFEVRNFYKSPVWLVFKGIKLLILMAFRLRLGRWIRSLVIWLSANFILIIRYCLIFSACGLVLFLAFKWNPIEQAKKIKAKVMILLIKNELAALGKEIQNDDQKELAEIDALTSKVAEKRKDLANLKELTPKGSQELTGLESSIIDMELRINQRLAQIWGNEMDKWLAEGLFLQDNADEIIRRGCAPATKKFRRWYDQKISFQEHISRIKVDISELEERLAKAKMINQYIRARSKKCRLQVEKKQKKKKYVQSLQKIYTDSSKPERDRAISASKHMLEGMGDEPFTSSHYDNLILGWPLCYFDLEKINSLMKLQDEINNQIMVIEVVLNNQSDVLNQSRYFDDQESMNWLTALIKQTNSELIKLKSYANKIQDIDLSSTSQRLEKDQHRVEVFWGKVFEVFKILLFILPPLFILTFIHRRINEKKALEKLDEIQNNYHRLLDFLRSKNYSLFIMKRAIELIRRVMPPTTENALRISEITVNRLSRSGSLNNNVGFELKEYLRILENKINR